MNLLAIESSSRKLTVGLFFGNKITKLTTSIVNDTASSLPLLTKKILKESSLKLSDLDAICLSTGPGSFTSLRIGMSYSKGLAISLDIPIVPISTFESLIHNEIIERVCILIYSHGKTFYKCEYIPHEGNLKCEQNPSTIMIEDILKLNDRIIYNGPKNYFNDFKSKKLNIDYKELEIENIIQIAKNNFHLLKTKSLDNLTPNYVGNFEIN